MNKLKSEFSKLFSEWFSMLVSDTFNVSLDDTFTPIVEFQDYIIEYNYLLEAKEQQLLWRIGSR